MAFAWDDFDACYEEVILDAIKHPKGFRFLKCSWRNDKEIASRANQLYYENVSHTNYDWYDLKNRMVKKNQVLEIIHLVVSSDCCNLTFFRLFGLTTIIFELLFIYKER